MKISAKEMINPIIIEQKGGKIDLSNIRNNVEKEFPYVHDFQSLLKEVEYAKSNVGNEQELLKAIHSLENEIRAGNKSGIASTANGIMKNFAGGVLQGVMGSALFEAVKAWALM